MERQKAKRVTTLILGAGFAASAVIFLFARAPESNPLGYDPLADKKYVLQLERYGGKANVVTAEFLQWFDGLWHGRPLACTVAVLTVVTARLFWLGATLPPLHDDEPGKPRD